MARYTEDDIAVAILVVTDEGLSLGQAALRFGIPKTTLSSRMRGRGAQSDQIQPKKQITND
jgi:DNA-directed RNA polymerase specialized sigma24 family protein